MELDYAPNLQMLSCPIGHYTADELSQIQTGYNRRNFYFWIQIQFLHVSFIRDATRF